MFKFGTQCSSWQVDSNQSYYTETETKGQVDLTKIKYDMHRKWRTKVRKPNLNFLGPTTFCSPDGTVTDSLRWTDLSLDYSPDRQVQISWL